MARESTESSLPPSELNLHRISLQDHTATEPIDQDPPQSLSASPTNLSKKFTNLSSLKGQRKQRKYARYAADRVGSIDSTYGQSTLDRGLNKIDRGRKRVTDKVFRTRRIGNALKDPAAEIDVLYECERGAFCFGYPYFSSKALGQWDAPAWANAEFKKSNVNIYDAQLPDPSWMWTWKNWYVDMDQDVDEEGWQYSFLFKGFSWHGTHPWFHSFVRRRKWIRQRTRKPIVNPDRVFGDAHMMNSDYFTIHSGVTRSPGTLQVPGIQSTLEENASVLTTRQWGKEEEDVWDDIDVQNIGTLLHGLKNVPSDSQRLSLMERFLAQGEGDLSYLGEEIDAIMSSFVYEYSCRRLLSILTEALEKAKVNKDDQGNLKMTESLHKAAEAVDEKCKQLSYWSDLKEITSDGKASDKTRTSPDSTEALNVVDFSSTDAKFESFNQEESNSNAEDLNVDDTKVKSPELKAKVPDSPRKSMEEDDGQSQQGNEEILDNEFEEELDSSEMQTLEPVSTDY